MKLLGWKPVAAAIGAVLAITGPAGAQDKLVRLGGTTSMLKGGGAATVTLGGKGTIDSAVQQDTVATRHGGGFHGGYGGYRGGYGGFGGYRGGYGGYRGGYGGYYGGYRGYYGGYRGYYRPYYGYGGYGLGFGLGYGLGYYGGYGGYGGGYYGSGYGGGYYGSGYGGGYYGGYPSYSSYGGGFCGIGLNGSVPAVNLGVSPAPAAGSAYYSMNVGGTMRQVPVIREPNNGTFPYHGNPAAPSAAPLEAPRAVPAIEQPTPAGAELQVASYKEKAKTVKTSYAYKAYGER